MSEDGDPADPAAPKPTRKKRRREGAKRETAGLAGGDPQTAGLAGGDPQTAGLAGGDPQTPGLAGGDPQTPEPAAELAPEAGPEPDERVPAFARAWPRDGVLDALVAAFEAGDYARVRREAPELARSTGDDAVRRAARELRRRLDPDPIAVYMLMAAAGLLVFLAGWYWLHPHTP